MGYPHGSEEQRFWAKVDKDGPLPKWAPFLGPCWLWTASLDTTGYGHLMLADQSFALAHRWSYEHHVGPIPEGLVIDHLCRIRRCMNPAHMEPVTRAENTRRGFSVFTENARKTHCVNGHEFTPENTYLRGPTKTRSCRACTAAAQRRYQARLRGVVA